ncbi:MAG: phosphatase PAP2 family protein [Oscillospiraceae bacterium]|nr:phosphatase PAP2 family protein [Oscillospiraceae bacterium]
MAELFELDGAVLMFVQERLRTDALDYVMIALSFIGNAGAVWLAICAAMAARKQQRRQGALLFACLALCFIVNNVIIKNAVARARPFEAMEGLRILVRAPRDWSFPSGHAASGFAAAFAISRMYGRRAALASYAAAALIAISRVYVGVHYPSDIVAGALFGTLCAAALFYLRPHFYRKPK